MENIGRVDAFLEKHVRLLPSRREPIEEPATLKTVLHIDTLCDKVDQHNIIELFSGFTHLFSEQFTEAAVSVNKAFSDFIHL